MKKEEDVFQEARAPTGEESKGGSRESEDTVLCSGPGGLPAQASRGL